MDTSTLFIKNMVCNRCIRVVEEELKRLGYEVDSIELGKVVLNGKISKQDLLGLSEVLLSNGFELIDDQQHQLIEKVKTTIIKHIHHGGLKPESVNFSDFLEQQTGVNYFSLSKLFSSFEGITLEKYIILQKIEKVKELLVYDEKTLSEIAFELEYSSVAHLSGQFKKVTGMTPSAFKKMTSPRRTPLDQVKKNKSS